MGDVDRREVAQLGLGIASHSLKGLVCSDVAPCKPVKTTTTGTLGPTPPQFGGRHASANVCILVIGWPLRPQHADWPVSGRSFTPNHGAACLRKNIMSKPTAPADGGAMPAEGHKTRRDLPPFESELFLFW